ncbi:hypothetical protein [Hyphomicrobium sp. 99]|uniref:hypothetical protein n=1 Tax=Hyphomicrobium sp. 99 TaxID=1163419 RepID=UPI0005F823BF|nr:hypothetical protein [Hyphomicrobium sp. 99]
MLEYARGSDAHPQPTCSASILLLKAIAASGASAYRNYEPALREWTGSVSLEPAHLRRYARNFVFKAQQEALLHREIFSRVIRTNA